MVTDETSDTEQLLLRMKEGERYHNRCTLNDSVISFTGFLFFSQNAISKIQPITGRSRSLSDAVISLHMHGHIDGTYKYVTTGNMWK